MLRHCKQIKVTTCRDVWIDEVISLATKLVAFGVNALALFIARFAKDTVKGLID